ncbi:SF3 helicase domain-containing protein [Methylorubrum populi]
MATDLSDLFRLAELAKAGKGIAKDNGPALTEDFIAQKFSKKKAGDLLYCHDTGRWYTYSGSIWKVDRSRSVFHQIRVLSRELTEGSDKKLQNSIRKKNLTSSVERFCQRDPIFAVNIECWDKDPWLLGTPDGTVDLKTGELRPSERQDRITKNTAVAPASTANCPVWISFLKQITQNNDEYIRFLQQWGGYCLTGDTREQALCFAFGGGGNGKGVFIHVLSGIMNDYAISAAMETFTASKYDRHPTEIAALRGARLVTASETETGRKWAESRIKQLTGGDIMRARYMRQDEFEFKPVLKLLIIGNNKPGLSSVDDAAKRRFNLLPFLFKPEKPDPLLEEKLHTEWPEILRWLIIGCLDWQENGLVRPEVVIAATEEYFSSQDIFRHWLEERCIVEIGNIARKCTSRELYESWCDYAKRCNELFGTQTSFGDMMEKMGFKKNKNVPANGGGRARGYEGISLRIFEGGKEP